MDREQVLKEQDSERALEEYAQFVVLHPVIWDDAERARIQGSLLLNALNEGMEPDAARLWSAASVGFIDRRVRDLYFGTAGNVGSA